MNRRWFLRAALVLVFVAGASFLGLGIYQAGLAAGLAADGAASTPVAPGYGYPGGFGFGFGIFGFFGMLLFFFLVFGLIRALLWGGRGWGGPGRWGPGQGEGRRHAWEGRAHEAFESWHRDAHDSRPTTSSDDPGSGATSARS